MSGTAVAARYIYHTTTPPAGLTEVTEAQFMATYDISRIYGFASGTLSTTGDRVYVFDGVSTPPASLGREDFIEP